MKDFKKVLGYIVGIASLLMMAAIILVAYNNQYTFMSVDLLEQIIFYAFPCVIALAALYFISDKGILLFVLTAILVAFALHIYFNEAWFFAFIDKIFP